MLQTNGPKRFPTLRHLAAEPRDLKFFFSWAGLLSATGAGGLAIAGIPEARSGVKDVLPPILVEPVRDNVWLLVIILCLMTTIPSVVSRGRRSISAKLGARDKNTELSTATVILSRRLAHLITKVRDSIFGERDKSYIVHTLQDCCKYFKQRGIKVDGVATESQVEAVLFEVVLSEKGLPARLERRVQTHETKGDFAPKISRSQNADSRALLDGVIVKRKSVFTSSDSERDSLRNAMGGAGEKYSEFLVVPVHRDRKIEGPEGIYGALMIMSEQPNTLRIIDHDLLSTFAWMCSSALSVDEVTRTAKTANVA